MKSILTIFLFMIAAAAIAQNSTNEKQLRTIADEYYNEEQYNLAIQYYQELVNLFDQDAELNYQLAESYRKTFKYVEAEGYYLKSHYQDANKFPLSLYYYALMLKLNGQFDESIASFAEFIFVNQSNTDLADYVEQATIDEAGSEMAKDELFKSNTGYPIKLENLNTSFNDYAPTLLDSTTLVITSGRVGSSREVIDERYGEAFTDNFYFTKNDNLWQDRTKQKFSATNTRYNDGSGCFNHDKNKYYFTVCGKESNQCHIYLSTLKDDKWTEPIALNGNINYGNFESKHPAVSKGGDTLLFSSNRSGGFGKYDIWISLNSGNENWGPAMNLGSIINTKLNELSPSFTDFSGVFFLASDGHQNYGGLDLYMAKRFSNGTVALYNLDYPFNSTYDDCFITSQGQKLYFSSNRKGGKGGFDIYSTTIPSVISFISKLSLKNRDARKDVKLNARVATANNLDILTARNEDRIEYENLTYDKKKIVDKIVSNQINNIITTKEDFQGVSADDYKTLRRISDAQYKTYETKKRLAQTISIPTNLLVDSSKNISIAGLLRDSISGKPLSFVKIILVSETQEILKVTSTNDLGKFRFSNVPLAKGLSIQLEKSYPDTLRSKIDNLTIADAENQNTFSFENIYFDFDQYVLRQEAKIVLNDLVDFLHHNPSMQVEIYAYADDRGNDNYNLILTQKRGQAVLNYLINSGIDQTSIVVTAKGRQKNPIVFEEVQRQFNRRVEFFLNGEKENSAQTVETYILKKNSDWISLSTSTGVNVEELKKLNGALDNKLQIYQPVRIPATATIIPDTLFFGTQLITTYHDKPRP